MANTIVEQTRKQITLSTGARKYQIQTWVTDRGDLPYVEIFVHRIQDPAITELDTFVRVASPVDLDSLYTQRDDAIVAGEEYFLSSGFEVRYDKLEDAVLAKEAVYSRIDTLCRDWIQYQADFFGLAVDTEHPRVDPTFEEQLISDYTDAKLARIAADQALVLAEVDESAKEEAVSIAADWVTKSEEAQDHHTAINTPWTTYKGVTSTFYNSWIRSSNGVIAKWETLLESLKTAYNNYSVLAGDVSTYPTPPTPASSHETERAAFLLAVTTFESYMDPTFKTQVSARGTAEIEETKVTENIGYYSTWAGTFNSDAIGDYNTAVSAHEDAIIAKNAAQVEQSSAEEAEEVALAALLAVCPDFDPDSVP